MDLKELLAERERLAGYGLHNALALIDAEIERLTRSDAAPVDRQAPARVTATSPPSKTAVRPAGKDKA